MCPRSIWIHYLGEVPTPPLLPGELVNLKKNNPGFPKNTKYHMYIQIYPQNTNI